MPSNKTQLEERRKALLAQSNALWSAYMQLVHANEPQLSALSQAKKKWEDHCVELAQVNEALKALERQ
jgi:hypothetical protein